MSFMLVACEAWSARILDAFSMLVHDMVPKSMFIHLGGEALTLTVGEVAAAMEPMQSVIIGAPKSKNPRALEITVARIAREQKKPYGFVFETEEEVRNPNLLAYLDQANFVFVKDNEARKAAVDLCCIAQIIVIGDDEKSAEVIADFLKVPIPVKS